MQAIDVQDGRLVCDSREERGLGLHVQLYVCHWGLRNV